MTVDWREVVAVEIEGVERFLINNLFFFREVLGIGRKSAESSCMLVVPTRACLPQWSDS